MARGFYEDVDEYMKQYAPNIGPLIKIVQSVYIDEDRFKSTSVVEGIQGTNGTIVKKQWKIFYNDEEELTNVVIPEEQWLEK